MATSGPQHKAHAAAPTLYMCDICPTIFTYWSWFMVIIIVIAAHQMYFIVSQIEYFPYVWVNGANGCICESTPNKSVTCRFLFVIVLKYRRSIILICILVRVHFIVTGLGRLVLYH